MGYGLELISPSVSLLFESHVLDMEKVKDRRIWIFVSIVLALGSCA